MVHAVIDGGGSGVSRQPPPPPTPENLLQASAPEAQRSIEEMTVQQRADLTEAVARMPVAERDVLANDLATKLPAAQLQQLEPVFGADVLLEAVQTRSPATVREQYETLTGNGSTTAAPAASGRSDQEQVEQARTGYADLERWGWPGQARMTELMAENAGDPAYLAELVRLADEGELLEAVVNPMYGALFEQDADGSYTSDSYIDDGEQRRNAFSLAIGAAIDRGVLTEGRLRELGVHSSGWQDVAARAGVGQVGSTDAIYATSLEFGGLLDAQGDAQRDVDKLDEELGGMLAQAGPLTPEQQAAFIEAFRNNPDHKPTYDRLIETTQAVSGYLAENREALLDAAVRDPAVAQQVNDAIQTLARNGHGVQAVELLIEIQRVPDSALAEAFSGFDLSGDVLTDAASSAMAELLERNDGSVSAAQAQFETLMAAVGEGIPAWGGYKDFSDAQKLIEAFANGDFRAIDLYAHRYNDTKPIVRAFLAAGIVIGAVSAANSGREGEYIDAIGGFAQTGENAARLVSGAMNSLADSGRLAQHAGRFAGAAGFAAKLAPALGLVAHAASFAHNFGEAANGNPGYAVALFGDVLGVLGSALEFTPAAPAGFVISGIGAIVSGLGSFVGELINGNARRAEVKGYLEEAGVDPAIIDELVASGKQLFELAETLELDAEQLQALLLDHPEIGASPGHAGTFMEVASASGVSGDDVAAFADALAGERSDFAWDLLGIRQHAPTNPDEAAAFYRNYIQANYAEAAAVAERASPELFGDAARQRENAVSDYNRDGFSMGWETNLANNLSRNDDPAYRAEMIGRIADDGRLDMWAEMIAGYGDHWEGAVRASVADAVQAGRISQADADMVLSYFG